MLLTNLPSGVAEAILFVLLGLFLAYLWWEKNFGKSNNSCAMADNKVQFILSKMEASGQQRQKLEEQLLDVHKQSVELNKMLMAVLQENTRANTILAERIRP